LNPPSDSSSAFLNPSSILLQSSASFRSLFRSLLCFLYPYSSILLTEYFFTNAFYSLLLPGKLSVIMV
jgi:hypothetical protein